jgi:hypothetical protein
MVTSRQGSILGSADMVNKSIDEDVMDQKLERFNNFKFYLSR